MNLVTGATGLLGGHLLFYLIKENPQIKIRATYRDKTKITEVSKLFSYLNTLHNEDLTLKNIDWVNCDLNSIVDLQKAVKECSYVYHCAAKVSFYKSDYHDCLKQNAEMTANVVDACLTYGIKKLAYVSSTAAVGKEKDGLTNEKNQWKLTKYTSGYSISKYKAELEVWRGINEGLNCVIINPCVILGAGNWKSSSLKIFETVEKGLKFYPPGTNAVVDARDVAKALIFLMNSEINAQRFLVIGSNVSYLDLFQKCADKMNKNAPKYSVPKFIAVSFARLTEPFQYFNKRKKGISVEMINSTYGKVIYDSKKLKDVLNFEFHSLEQTIDYCVNGRID